MVESVARACAGVLNEGDPAAKPKLARRVLRDWRAGRLARRFDLSMPDRPAVPSAPVLRPPRDMPRRGRGGSVRSRVALLHALAHIEYSAIDLAFDLVGRFGAQFPRAFVDDWLRVGGEEAMHFALLDRRLAAHGARYGDLPAHAGLWDAATATRHDAAARLAIVPLVLEARGLDVTPQTIERLRDAGDEPSARLLTRILSDETAHVRTGVRWFEAAVTRHGLDPAPTFRSLVVRHFGGTVKPPFNHSARDEAGLPREYYAPLAH